MRWRCIGPLVLPALVVLIGGPTPAQDKPTAAPGREADRLAIEKLTTAMSRAFEKRDAAAAVADWAEDGEFVHNGGDPVRGRAAIRDGYAAYFKTLKGKPKLEVRPGAVRFPSADVAVADTTLRLRDEDGVLVAAGRQEAVLVREGGRWTVAVVRAWDRDLVRAVGLKDLEWLIGTWQAVDKDRAVSITYEWDENKAFIRGRFTVSDGGKVVESGTQTIGMDNAAGVIRWWAFQSDGGFGSGVWARDGKNWRVTLHGVRADGGELTGTALYTPVDPDRVTWQAVNQTVDGAPVADTPPIKVTRQKPAK